MQMSRLFAIANLCD